ncbi:PREDICTED: uncharacterized protein At1g66480-like [Ipomoea nil]|uniref:uncharacterized protein At1g66480-like n=1 Tax=Ipomoea nil TaxID=35883 RepID=UPI0009011161|nr:PREDICTED: uncharacterized protein At1g66480-like [Ipomoea nil]XP_019182463.1 PREDICTED: uncharacterized protein At1g66480-like [Ipomoea nil]
MGNNIGGGSKTAKVMKMSGETFKLRATTATAFDVLKDYPGHVLLDSESVKRSGIRAKPLETQQELRPKKVYFLVELPRFPDEERAMSGRAAKDRLECLMLKRRSMSDVSAARQSSGGPVQLKIRLPRNQVEKVIGEGRDEAEVARKIFHLCLQNSYDIC